MEEEVKVGVYVCECGINIAATVDVERVAEFASTLPNVAVSRYYKYMCSDPGQTLIKKDIEELGLNRIVVASCSPRMHEPTFRAALEEAGLNQYCFEMANIREQCSWVHKDKDKATKKAMELIAGAVARAATLQPLERMEAPVTPSALVIGGGIAGIQAALDIADMGYKTYLVEKSPSVGGRMAQLDKTFPTLDCSACILTPKMVDVARHKNIELLTCAEVSEVDGYVGNFKVKVKQNPRYVDSEICTGCGICAQVDLDKDEGIEKDGYLLVDRVEIIDEKCKQCGDCVDACLEKNEDNYAMTNYFVERKRTHAGEKTHDLITMDHHIIMGDIYDMTRDEREEFWEEQFNKCIKCYSCREVCPLCVCKYCELEDSNWVKPGEIPPDYPIFHIIRAFHLAGKCVGCGECEKACPMDIPLRALQDLVRNEDPEKVFEIVPGLSRRMKHRLMKQVKRYPTEKRKVKI